MPNPEHLEILRKGVETWNLWRKQNPHVAPDLSETDLSNLSLRSVNFARTDLSRAKIIGGDLTDSYLASSHLIHADFRDADFSQANLTDANLWEANLFQVKFTGAELCGANFTRANLCRANLRHSNLSWATLIGSDLDQADLTESFLGRAIFTETVLSETNFTHAFFGETVLTATDLSEAIGLETVEHGGPSSLGLDTLLVSNNKIPQIFLRGCGVPEIIIEYAASLTGKAIEYYSCFISYSSKNQDFAERLYADLQNNAVRCWFAPEDIKIGDKFRIKIDEAIRVHDKLLLILSEISVNSDWVEKEVETAFERERKEKRTMLFPIRLDDIVNKIESGWPADVRRTRHIGDFSNWKDHDVYQRALDRLLRDLKAEKVVKPNV